MTEKLRTSSSQTDLVISCPRRWYFRYVNRLPEDKSNNTILGDIGHGVCERWYPNEELYPEGWAESINRWTGEPTGDKINKAEQALVQKLIAHAIKDGMLTRLPDGEVEKELRFRAMTDYEGYNVTFNGFIDYFSASARHIEDHKFCKSFKWYGKTKLTKAIAMNAYAYAAYSNGWIPKDESIWLRYNLFRKDPKAPKTQKVEVEVTWEQAESFWNKTILPAIKDMVRYKKNAKTFNDVPVAANRAQACRAFGKVCDFFDICEGKETPDQYKARKDGSVLEGREDAYRALMEGGTLNTTTTKENTMSGFNEMLNNAGRSAAATPAATQAAPVAQATATQTPPAAQQAPATEARQRMPWHDPTCKACEANDVLGMASNGDPCQICDHLGAVKEGGITSFLFKITTSPEGTLIATPREAAPSAEVTAEIVPEAQTVTESVQPAPAPVAEEPVAEVQVAEAPTAPVAEAPKAEAQEEEKYESTAGQGVTDISRGDFADMHYKPECYPFTLSFVPVSNRRGRSSKKLGEAGHIVRFNNFFESVASELLRVYNAENPTAPVNSFYDLNTWERKEAISRNSNVWAEMLGNSTVECLAGSSLDAGHLLGCLEAKAQMVFGSPVR